MSYLYNETLGSTIYDTNYTNSINDLKNRYYNEQKKKLLTHHNLILLLHILEHYLVIR